MPIHAIDFCHELCKYQFHDCSNPNRYNVPTVTAFEKVVRVVPTAADDCNIAFCSLHIREFSSDDVLKMYSTNDTANLI